MAITYSPPNSTPTSIGTRVDSGSGSPTIAYPSGITSGDLLIVFAFHKAATVIAAPTSTLTWTEVATSSALNNEAKIWTATYDGSATAPTIATGGISTYAIMAAIRGQAASSLDASANLAVSQVNMRYPALTITNDNEIVFTFCEDKAGITSVAQTSGFTEIEDYNGGGSNWGVQIQYQIQTSKTNISQTDPVVTGGSSATQIGITVAFIAATTGGFLLSQTSNQGGF